jgi:hypothetical protein
VGYRENFEAVTLDKTVRGRIRLALVKKAMAEADDGSNTFDERRLIHQILDRMDETFLTELGLAVVQDAANVDGATDAQVDARIGVVWPKLIAGFTEPVAPEPVPPP